jgi:hypothetical protein
MERGDAVIGSPPRDGVAEMKTQVAWNCDFCTFKNPISTKICAMCSKTNAEDGVAEMKTQVAWNCDFCTFKNPMSTKICAMCSKTNADAPIVQ